MDGIEQHIDNGLHDLWSVSWHRTPMLCDTSTIDVILPLLRCRWFSLPTN